MEENTMKAEELRIGNIVDTAVGVIRIEEIPLKSNPLYNPNALHPIILSEDWLLKFGFHKDVAYYKIGVNDMNYCLLFRDWASNYSAYVEYTDSPDPRDFKAMYPISFDISYVHQLQNLYFALTGEELTLKP